MDYGLLSSQLDKAIKACYMDDQINAYGEIQAFIETAVSAPDIAVKLMPILNPVLAAMELRDLVLVGDYLEFSAKNILRESGVYVDLNSKKDYIGIDAQQITALSDVPEVDEDIFYFASCTDEPVLCVKSGEGKTVRLNSVVSPENEAEVWNEELDIRRIKSVVSLFGIGTGLFAEKILERITVDSKLIIYEPDRKIIDYCIESGKSSGENSGDTDNQDNDIEKKIARRIEKILADKRVNLCIESEDKLKFKEELISKVDYYILEGLVIAKHNNYDKIYPESFKSYIGYLNENRERILVNKNTLARFKENAMENVFKNLWICRKMNLISELGEEKGDLRILPKDIPVILVSAGPSLDKNVETLRKAKGHALIVAVDTAIKYLMKKDIMPDLTVTVEPIKPAEHYADERVRDIPAVFDIESNPEIVGKHRGRILLYNCRDYIKNLLESVGKKVPGDIASGGSVATAAFAIMYQLEQRKIIMVGQDLAYSGEATHAGGVESKGINNEIGYEMVEDIYGGMVRTRSDWIGYLKWFENAITVLKDLKKDIRVIDATEGGAKIHGSEIMTLEEALDSCRDEAGNLPEYDFEKELSKLPPFLNDNEVDRFLQKHREAVDGLEEVKRKASEACAECGEFLKACSADTCLDQDSATLDKNVIRESVLSDSSCKKLNVEMHEKYTNLRSELAGTKRFCETSPLYPLINNYAVSDIAEEVSKLRLSETEGNAEINEIKQMQLAFGAIRDAAYAVKTASITEASS